MPAHDDLRVALAGAGARGREHAAAVAAVEGLELVAVADPRADAAAALGVPAHASVEALLHAGVPDVLVLATPPLVRLEPVTQAAGAGVRAIVVEKPLAPSAAAATAMATACEHAGALLVPVHQMRFVPAFEALREAVAAGELGKVELIRATSFGDLADQGPHLIDMIQWLTGARVEWVMAQHAGKGSASAAGDFHTAHLALTGGVRAVLEAGPLHQRPAGITDDWLAKRVTVVGSGGVGEAVAAADGHILTAAGQRTLRGEHASYVAATPALHASVRDALRDGHPHRGSAADAVHGIAVLEAMAASVAGGERVLPGTVVASPNGSARPGPDISVLLPLTDHRGLLPACLEGWRAQRLADARYQLVLVADGREPDLEAQARAFLRPHDELIVVDGAHLIVLYDRAARAAASDLLLLSEPHCVPEPRCLDEVLRFMEGGVWDGACLRSTALGGVNALARADERMFEEGFAKWSAEGHWCKVILRGFAVRRAAYLAAGGLRDDCGRFAEFVLGMRLHETGARLGYAAGACVQHHYTGSFAELAPPVFDFAGGECAWRECGGADADDYVGVAREWSARRELDRTAARALAIPAARNLARRSVWRSSAARRANLRALRRHGLVSVAGPAGRVWEQRARLLVTQARCRALATLRPEASYRAYLDAYEGLAGLGRLRWLAEHRPAPAPLAPRERLTWPPPPPTASSGFTRLRSISASASAGARRRRPSSCRSPTGHVAWSSSSRSSGRSTRSGCRRSPAPAGSRRRWT